MIEPELPKGWICTELNNFAEIILGPSPPSSTYNEEHIGLPFYQGKLEFGSIYPTPRKWCSAPKKIAEKGDVLISVRAPVGPTNVCPEKSCIGRGLAAIRGKKGIEVFFILYLIRSVEKAISEAGTGSTFDAINGDQLKLLRLPLAPLAEQHRIVAKIEELLSHLDAGVEGLLKAKMQLSRYRQVILKAAVEGRLTKDWRNAHPEVEPAEVLLERPISKEWKGEYIDREISDLPNVPSDWVWANLGEIGNVSGGLTKNSKRNDFLLKMPYLRVANVYAGELRLAKMKEIGLGENELARVLLSPGDLLVVEGNGSPDQIGRVALWDGSISPCVHQNHIIKVRFNSNRYWKIYSLLASLHQWARANKQGSKFNIGSLYSQHFKSSFTLGSASITTRTGKNS